ncbi:hypothetical protein CPB85DRAFT_112020 [Mucidula mucida]|nr:hypothetical protein CPB85DRAFT_112020 [Mucidula mucida]
MRTEAFGTFLDQLSWYPSPFRVWGANLTALQESPLPSGRSEWWSVRPVQYFFKALGSFEFHLQWAEAKQDPRTVRQVDLLQGLMRAVGSESRETTLRILCLSYFDVDICMEKFN